MQAAYENMHNKFDTYEEVDPLVKEINEIRKAVDNIIENEIKNITGGSGWSNLDNINENGTAVNTIIDQMKGGFNIIDEFFVSKKSLVTQENNNMTIRWTKHVPIV